MLPDGQRPVIDCIGSLTQAEVKLLIGQRASFQHVLQGVLEHLNASLASSISPLGLAWGMSPLNLQLCCLGLDLLPGELILCLCDLASLHQVRAKVAVDEGWAASNGHELLQS